MRMMVKTKLLGDACQNCEHGERYNSYYPYRVIKGKDVPYVKACFCNKSKRQVDLKGWCENYV